MMKTLQQKISFWLIVLACISLSGVISAIPKSRAGSLIAITKSIINTAAAVNTDASYSSVVSAVSSSDVLLVTVTVTNYGSSPTVTINDSYAGFSTPVTNGTVSDTALGWSGGGGSFSSVNSVLTVTSPTMVSGTTKSFSYTITPANMPNNKPRMLALPISTTSSNFGISQMMDTVYVMELPNSSAAGSSFVANTYNNASGGIDLSFVVPAVSVLIGNTTLYSSTTTLSTPKQDSTVTGNNSTDCNSITISYSRGGSCMYNTTATVSTVINAKTVTVGSASAQVMTVPPSAIVGNIKVGGSTAAVGNVLLPGQHLSSNTDSSSASQSIAYSIDSNSVSGLKGSGDSDVFGNVYLDANLALAKRNPDFLLDNASYTSYGDLINVGESNISLSCAAGAGNNCGAGGTPATAKYVLSAKNGLNFDLSSIKMSNITSTPKNPKNSGYLWYVKGDLTITGLVASTTITNVGIGTIFVEGKLIISDLSVSATGKPLGFIATNGIEWKIDRADVTSSTLNSVAFFSNLDFTASTIAASQSLKLVGSVVARQTVSFADVKLPNISDNLNLLIQYDQALTTNPPPRMSKLATQPSASGVSQ
ncbi:MAG: hypothetical protein WC773_00525 [Patescibacteria group bacterium]|jgi:hypothetical protein